jgi:acyl carrier protein
MSSTGLRSREEILQKFSEIVADSLCIDQARVTETAYLDELGAESLDLLEITMEAEDAFDILIPQKNILQIAQEVFGDGVLIESGKLTEEGKRFLVRRMPEFEALVSQDVHLKDLNKLFLRVDSWVRMIAGLVERTPRVCPKCGSPFGKAVTGRFKCSTCQTEENIPSGDDLNREWVRRYYEQEHTSSTPRASVL